MDAGIVRSSSQ